VIPARRASRLSIAAGLRFTGAGVGLKSRRLGHVFVGAQIALAFVLVIGGGLFIRTLQGLERQDIGFDRDRIIEVFTAPEQANIARRELADLFDAAVTHLRAIPGVQGVAASSRGLLTRYAGMVRTTVPGYTRREDESEFVAYNYLTPGFFSTAGMTLSEGRDV